MLDYAAKMARHHHEATQEDIQKLRDVGFSDADILHMVYWIASFNMANTITDCLGYEPHEHITAIFVDEDAAAEYDPETAAANALSQEAVRPGWERGIVRALEGRPLEWLNAPPLTWSDVRGKVLLVMYWDALLPNSLIGLPHLQRWHDRYAKEGAVVLAPHTPEFPAAKDRALVERTVATAELTVPVILDPDFRQMAGANNRYWPAIHLIDRNGYVRYRHYGPGGYDAIEALLQQLLAEDAAEPSAAATLTVPDELRHAEMRRNRWIHPAASPEFYACYKLGRKTEGIAGPPGRVKTFTMPDVDEQQFNSLYVSGDWIPHSEGRILAEDRGRMALEYCAERGGMVISPGERGPITLRVWLDGQPLRGPHAGRAVDENGQVTVGHVGYYELVTHPDLEKHRLEIEIQGEGAFVHRFNFLPFCGVDE